MSKMVLVERYIKWNRANEAQTQWEINKISKYYLLDFFSLQKDKSLEGGEVAEGILEIWVDRTSCFSASTVAVKSKILGGRKRHIIR